MNLNCYGSAAIETGLIKQESSHLTQSIRGPTNNGWFSRSSQSINRLITMDMESGEAV